MIIDILKLLGIVAIWFGVIFNALGVIGLLRLPDVYSRLHATSKVATLGLLGLLLGAAFIMGEVAILRALALGVFMLITAPMAGHVIAKGAHEAGVPMIDGAEDEMAEIEAARAEKQPSTPVTN